MKLFFVFTGLILLVGRVGEAKESRVKEAQAAYAEGVALYEAEDFIEAAEAFRRANKIKYNWKVLYNIGQCEAAAKRHGMALQAFEEYLTRSGDDISVDRRDEVLAEVNRLRQMVGFLEVEGPEGGDVLVDGEHRGTLPMAGPVAISAGVNHVVSVVLDNEELYRRELRMVGGQSKTVKVSESEPMTADSANAEEMTAENSDDTFVSAPSENTKETSKLKVAGWVTFSMGLALAVGGGVAGGLALQKANQLESDYPDGVPEPKHDEYDSAYLMANISNVLIAVGATAAVTGVILLIANKKKNRSEQLSLIPAVGPSGGGVFVKGMF